MLGASSILLEAHKSYQGEGMFLGGYEPQSAEFGSMSTRFLAESRFKPTIIRDLTMPKRNSMPLYDDSDALQIVNAPIFNTMLSSKSTMYELFPDLQPFSITKVLAQDIPEAVAAIPGKKVVVKPNDGRASQGIFIGDKSNVVTQAQRDATEKSYIVQELIDMSGGLAEHNISGVHNVRFVVIGRSAMYGFIRDDPSGDLAFAGESETFSGRSFKLPEDYSIGFQQLLMQSQEAIGRISGAEHAIFAIDLIRGINAAGEQKEYLLEVNRKPLRNSPYDGTDAQTTWAAQRWDAAEAQLLVSVLK